MSPSGPSRVRTGLALGTGEGKTVRWEREQTHRGCNEHPSRWSQARWWSPDSSVSCCPGVLPTHVSTERPCNFPAPLHPASAGLQMVCSLPSQMPRWARGPGRRSRSQREERAAWGRQQGGAVAPVGVGDTPMARREGLSPLGTANTKAVSPEWFPPSSDTGGNGETPVKSKK